MLNAALTRLGRSSAARPVRHLLDPLVSRIAVPLPARLATGHTCYVDTRSVIGRGVLFSLLALSKMREGVAHAFEVDPPTLRCLRMTRERGRLKSLIVHGCGPGEQRSTAGLQAEEEFGWTHVDFANSAGPRFDILPLDDFAGDFMGRPVIAMTMDVEGMELAVARGVRQVLTGCRPLVACEAIDRNLARYGASVPDLVAFMASLRDAASPLEATDDPIIVFTPEPV
jgi:hypothetical protein